eukprot:11891813-Prorocentrum_lima.AAC.1
MTSSLVGSEMCIRDRTFTGWPLLAAPFVSRAFLPPSGGGLPHRPSLTLALLLPSPLRGAAHSAPAPFVLRRLSAVTRGFPILLPTLSPGLTQTRSVLTATRPFGTAPGSS